MYEISKQMDYVNPAACEALETLPHSIGDVTALRSLDMTGCSSLAWLPRSIGALASLERLSLARCVSLGELAPQISALTSLCSLDIGELAPMLTQHQLPSEHVLRCCRKA